MLHDLGMDVQNRRLNGETRAATLFQQTSGWFLGGLFEFEFLFCVPFAPVTLVYSGGWTYGQHKAWTRRVAIGAMAVWGQGTAG